MTKAELIEELRKAKADLEEQIAERERAAEAARESEAALMAAKVDAELANRAKSEFLANMSHELRTPLNTIIGFAEIIQNEMFGPVGVADYLDHAQNINQAGHELVKLINDLLELARIETGTVELREVAIDVLEIIRSCLVLMGGRAHRGGLTLEQKTPEKLPQLYADERMIKQILVNLLSNAIKFTPAGGSVTVRAWCQSRDGCVLQITDTGTGMTLEDIPKAMIRFAQVDGHVVRKFAGLGLGLPLAKSLIELHSGSLDLQSQVGIGTTVTVRFPAERIVKAFETRTARLMARRPRAAAT